MRYNVRQAGRSSARPPRGEMLPTCLDGRIAHAPELEGVEDGAQIFDSPPCGPVRSEERFLYNFPVGPAAGLAGTGLADPHRGPLGGTAVQHDRKPALGILGAVLRR